MKINAASLLFEAVKYWIKNGKTTTALIIGVITSLVSQTGVEISPENFGMIIEALEKFIPFLTLLGVGVADKIRKLLVKIAAEKENG